MSPLGHYPTEAWRPLYRVAAYAAIAVLVMIPIAILAYVLNPPPSTAEAFFALFHRSAFIGLVALDLLYMIDIALMGVVMLAIGVALFRSRPAMVTLALFAGLGATVMYFSSNTAFEMLTLSTRYAAADTEAQRQALLAAGEAMLAIYTGTALNVSYVVTSFAGLILALVMWRTDIFSRVTAGFGIAMSILGLVPSSAGTVGLVFSFAYLVPFVVWIVLVARRLLQLANGAPSELPTVAARRRVQTRPAPQP